MNSRAQYLYHDQRNSETGRSNSPQNKRYVDDRPDRQSPNKFSSSSQNQRHKSPNSRIGDIKDKSLNKHLNMEGSGR